MSADQAPLAAWCATHADAAEWVWHLPSALPLTALQPWLNQLAQQSLLRPLHLWLHHPSKQAQSAQADALTHGYASAAPGLNTVVLTPRIRLSVWIGPQTPQWPSHNNQGAYLALDHHLQPLETIIPKTTVAPWYAPAPVNPVKHVCIVGAGIAGASTAYALAIQGVHVTVLEQGQIAGAASGNRQGLVYAKISPHLTEQSQLLLNGYGFTLRLLQTLLPERDGWDDCGVLHLDVTAQEQKRNQALATWPYPELWMPLTQAQASQRAGLPLPSGGLFWPQGGWVHPPTLIAKLLDHPNIRVVERCTVNQIEPSASGWLLHTNTVETLFSASHLVLCQGHLARQFLDLAYLPLNPIRGQVTHSAQPPSLSPLRIALSGHSYVSPPWQGQYCFGASFQAGVCNTTLTQTEERDNVEALNTLCPELAQSLAPNTQPQGKAAMRCDSHDHLPVVGAIGPRDALYAAYAELAIDKTRPIDTPCTFYPNLYVNTAHGTRGLATAPLCGFALAHELLGHSQTLSPALREALHPHRFWIRQIIRRQWDAADDVVQ